MNIPINMVCIVTMVWKEQDKVVKMSEELIEQGYKFEGKGIYSKAKERIIFKTGYDDKLEKDFYRQVEFNEIEEIKTKPKRKKRLKPAQKNKKRM